MASKPFFDPQRGNWYQKYKPDPAGPWIRIKLCRHPEEWSKTKPPKKPPQIAIDRAREYAEIEYRARHHLGSAPVRPKGFDAYLADFLEVYRKSRDPGSVRQMERHVKSFSAFTLERGITTIQGVTKSICRDYLERRFKNGASYDTLKTERGYLVGIWSRAVDDGLITVNPWSKVKPPGKPAVANFTFWSEEQIERIAANCGKPWQSTLIQVLGSTGIRVSTALAMRWSWFDWGQRIIHIPKGLNIKTSYDHTMSSKALDLLEKHLMLEKVSDLVFPNPYGGKIVPYETVQVSFKKAVAKAGVKPGTVHDLRHSYARARVMEGFPLPIVQRQLGHSTITMTMRYASADDESVRAALDRAERPPTLLSPSPTDL